MQVTEVLDKISEHNAPVIGCIAAAKGQVFQNLNGYDLNCALIADKVRDIMELSALAGEEGADPFETVMIEYDGHSLVVNRMTDGLLIVISEHLQHGAFKKLQVGLSLQARMLDKALADMPDAMMLPVPIEDFVEPLPADDDATDAEAEAGRRAHMGLFGWRGLGAALSFRSRGAQAEGKTSEGMPSKVRPRRVYRGQIH